MASLAIALVLVPLAVYLTLRGEESRGQSARAALYGRFIDLVRASYEHSFGPVGRVYQSVLAFFIGRRLEMVLVLVLVLAFTLGGPPKEAVSFVGQQEDEAGGVEIGVEMPGTYTLEESAEWFAEAEKIVEAHAEELGVDGWLTVHRRNWGELEVWFTTPRKKGITPRVVTERLLELLPERPGMTFYTGFEVDSEESKGPETFLVTLQGEDPEQLSELTENLQDFFVSVPGVLGVKRSSDDDQKELGLVVDRERAQRLGANPEVIAGVVGSALRGMQLPKFNDDGVEVPVRVRFEESDRETLDQLESFLVPTENGALPISALTRSEVLQSPSGIFRSNQKITSRTTLELEEGDEEKTRERLGVLLASIDLPEGVSFGVNSQAQRQDEERASLFFRAAALGRLHLPLDGLSLRELHPAPLDPAHHAPRVDRRVLDPLDHGEGHRLPRRRGRGAAGRRGRQQRDRAGRLRRSPSRRWPLAPGGRAGCDGAALPPDHDDRDHDGRRHGAPGPRRRDQYWPQLHQLRADSDRRNDERHAPDAARGPGLLHALRRCPRKPLERRPPPPRWDHLAQRGRNAPRFVVKYRLPRPPEASRKASRRRRVRERERMNETQGTPQIEIFSTSPQSIQAASRSDYMRSVEDRARWSEECGCAGTLIYTDNRLIDPWVVADAVLRCTEHLLPLVATQPIYMHPFAVAKKIATFAWLYGRRTYLNMVAGGFKKDLEALGDQTPHDDRYLRLTEYTSIITRLLASSGPISLEGRYYEAHGLQMVPPLDPDLQPGIFLSGSSPAGQQAAKELGATAIEYPKPGSEYQDEGPATGLGAGLRVGLIADPDYERAWARAHERFPEDRKGQIAHKMAMKVSDSHWHRQISDLDERPEDEPNPYWLGPFKNYKTFCPYLVGSDETVSDELASYIRAGFRVFILDIPSEREDLEMASRVFELAKAKASS